MTSPTKSTQAPTWRSTSIIVKTSAMRGTFVSTVRPWASSEAAMSLRAEFFAPETTTEPESRRPPSTYKDPMERRFYSCAARAPRQCAGFLKGSEDLLAIATLFFRTFQNAPLLVVPRPHNGVMDNALYDLSAS